MPRPQRISARERSLVGETQDEEDNIVAAGEEAVDNDANNDNALKSGQVSEGESDPTQRLARRFGWVPKEEWKRDPEKWVDESIFLERTPDEMAQLKERVRRSGQVAEDLAEQARRDAKAQAQAELREAARSGDEERAVKAAEKVAEHSGPHPQTAAWMARNSWFDVDQEARAVAITAINRAGKDGLSIEAQLQAGEAAVKRRFPEHFDAPRETRNELRLSDVRYAPPAVAGGSRGTGQQKQTKDKGWSDMPAVVRNQMQRFVKEAERHGKTEAESTAAMAASYWKDQA